MPIPVAINKISIHRVEWPDETDGYDPPPAPTLIASNVRAVIPPPSGVAQLGGGDRVTYEATMSCDPVDLQPADTVTSDDGTTWTCITARHFAAFGISMVQARLRLVSGAV